MIKKIYSWIKKDWVAYICIALYFILASLRLRYPGVQYDEIFFGNAAFGGTADNTFVNVRLGSIPLFTLEYIGALKSWVYFPLFKLFGVSYWSLRLPMILLSCVSLYLLFQTVKQIAHKTTALFILVISALDPIIIAETRVDFGPVAFSYFFRTLSLYLFFLFVKSKKKSYLGFLVLVLFLGWFNKMDFIWFASSFVVSSCLFYRQPLSQAIVKGVSKRMKVLFLFIVFLFVLISIYLGMKLGFVRIFFFMFKTIDFFYLKHLINVLVSTINLIGGWVFYNTLYTPLYPLISNIYAGVLLFLVLGNTFYELFIAKRKNIAYLFLFFTASIIYFQIIITSRAGAPWHLIYIYPIWQILLGLSFLQLSEKLRKKWMLYPVLIILLVYQLIVNFIYIQHYGQKTLSVNWSKAIYELIDYAQKHDNVFVSVDWGTHNQLLIFDYQKGKYFDAWPKMAPDPIPQKDYEYLINNYFKNISAVFILHPEKTTVFPSTRKNFFRLAKENNLILRKIKEFRDGDEVIYELYTLSK